MALTRKEEVEAVRFLFEPLQVFKVLFYRGRQTDQLAVADVAQPAGGVLLANGVVELRVPGVGG